MATEDNMVAKKIEELDHEGIIMLLERNGMDEFIDFVKKKGLDGQKLLDVSEGIVKIWRPKANAKNLMSFIEYLKRDPENFLHRYHRVEKSETVASIESQYQTVKKVKEDTVSNTVEDLIKRLVPAKSFLYRNQPNKHLRPPSYLPMDSGVEKNKKTFRLSSYEYPFVELRNRFSKQESTSDRYYCMKTNSRYYVQKVTKKTESKPKYKSLSAAEETEKYPEDHFYEDLCYNEVENKTPRRDSFSHAVTMKPCIVKIQELFQSFRMPFFKRNGEMLQNKDEIEESKENIEVKDKDTNLYENSDSIGNMYDSVHVIRPVVANDNNSQATLPVEDYLEPVQLNKEYCDVSYKKDDSLLSYIMSIFDTRFGMRRETNEADESDSDLKSPSTSEGHTSMVGRPLPVPVENEPYYMNIERGEAENLLRGQPDGTFVLRPSSQPSHAYTITVSCADAVHNVGVRRRPDGRLALGYPRRGERSFTSVTSLLRHHRKKRLMLVAAGGVIGGTTLNDTPQYYQVPTGIPISV